MSRAALRVLVVDDNRSAADGLARVLRRSGHHVETSYDGGAAIAVLAAEKVDVVLTDLRMEPVDGMEVLRAARSHEPPIEVIVFTAYGEIETAVEAMRLGARDFLTKPVTVEQVTDRLQQISTPELSANNAAPKIFIARSASAIQLLAQLNKVADVPTSVWIEGDIGTGRGHTARTLHSLGTPQSPFTLADPRWPEPWPSAGTVVLPNLDDLGEAEQLSLHKALTRVPPAVRLIATSGPGASLRVTEGRLRRELYYQLAVVVIAIPLLRDRPEDILPLMNHALDLYAERYHRERPNLTEAQEQDLLTHTWPGNVRELMNLAERAVVMGEPGLSYQVNPPGAAGLPELGPEFSLAAHLEAVERAILVEALNQADGDRALAGRLLGVERNTLRYKLTKYDLLT